MKKKTAKTPKPKAIWPIKERAKDVHTEHCCLIHGCKYGEDDFYCSVATGRKPQSFPCEHCGGNDLEFLKRFQKILGKLPTQCPNCKFSLNEKA